MLLGMEKGESRRATVLPDELIVEILARLPVKSLCRCKCVSRAWRTLISDPDHRGRFAQTLSGLFFSRPSGHRPPWPRGFVGLPTSAPPGVDTALSFLPPTCGGMDLLDSCNGLLLLRCEDTRERPSPPPFYVVCNPATGEWVALPQSRHTQGLYGPPDTCSVALGFDPAVSTNFHVFQLVQECYFHNDLIFVVAVEIYSSETGRWVFKENNDLWVDWDIRFSGQMTFFSGFLHFCNVSNAAVISVDTEVQAWRISHVPHNVSYGGLSSMSTRHDRSYGRSSTISHSQGRLLYVYDNGWQDHDLSIYVLEDQDSKEWTWILKQSIDKPSLFGPRGGWDYCIAAFHPNANLVFFYDWKQKTLMVYDMKHKDVHVIRTLGEVVKIELDLRCNVHRPFLPYVPLYTRALTSPSVN
jgi:hypothetical protein